MSYMPRIHAGFVMPAAIFLLVVLAALGAFMLNFSSTQHIASAQDVQGSRVYWSARAGVEWAVSKINSSGSCASAPATIEGFTITVACPSDTHDEAGVTRTVYNITVTAQSAGTAGSPGYVERELSARVER